MRHDALSRLTIGSTLGELPGFEETYELDTKAGVVGQLFERRAELPGVLVASRGEVVTAVSRRYYLDAIGRYLGHDVYTPRPLSVLLRRFEELGGALLLPAATPIPDAVRAGLERPRELVYEPVVVRAEGTRPARIVDFEDLLLADSRVTQLRNGQMRQILATVCEGLVLVGRDHRLASEHSDSAATVFGTAAVAGRHFEELLAEGLDAERCSLAGDYLDTLFDARIIESLVVKVNPLMRVTTRFGGRERVLEFRFARGGEGGHIDHVLVRVEDVSRREELASELEAQRERADQRLALAMGLSHADPGESGPFLAAVEEELWRLASVPGRVDADPANGAERARTVHRLKGEAGLLGLAPFELALHRVEDGLRVKDDIRVKENLRRDDGGSTLGAALLDLESLRRDAAELIERFGRLAFNQRPRERESRHADAGDVASQTAPATWPALWRDLDRLAQRVAADLGKRVRVCAAVEGGAPPPSWREPLRDVLVQLLRNAVAHGVEAPAERERAGKPAEGLVQVALRRHPDAGAGPGAATGWLELIVQDDGRGVDAGAVRRRAEQLGIPAPAGGEWSELLFHPGFSTAEVPHLHAGRGVGLDTVRDLVAARGGRVELHSEPGRFCAARVLVPLGAPVVPSRAVPA